MSIKFIQLPTCHVAEFVAAAATSFDVAGFLYNDGVTPVDPADIGDVCFATLEPKTAREELISFTIDSVTAGGVATITATRGLSQKSPYGTGGAAFDHQNGSDFVISNNPGLFNKLAAKANDETITGSWQFPAPSHVNNPATKTYTDTALATKVGLTGDEEIAGEKTFSTAPKIPDSTAADEAITRGEFDDEAVVLTGDQTVAGVKTFSSSPIVPTATTATQAVNKSQVEAYVAANSGDIKASDSAFGTVKLNEPADNITEPIAVAATTKTQNFISAITGMVVAYAGNSTPSGFLACDGAAVSRTTYAALYTVIGDSYGEGDGLTTFNVPDLRGSVAIGKGQKSKSVTITFASTDVDTSTNKITLPSESFLPTGQAVSITGTGVIAGQLTQLSTGCSVDTSAWISIGTNPMPAVNDIIAFSSNSIQTTFIDGAIAYVKERDTTNGKFRVAATLGGATITTITPGAGSVAWCIGSNTEGTSGDVSYDESAETLGIGNNSIPSVNDKVLITYDSSATLNTGDVYTVLTSANPFGINSTGDDSGTVRWVKIPPTLSQPLNSSDTFYVINYADGKISLARTLAEAVSGTAIDFYYAGTGNMTLSYTMSLTSRTVGNEGGEEGHVLSTEEMPSSFAEAGTAGTYTSGGSPLYPVSTLFGQNAPHNNMPPFLVISYIIKT